MYYIIDLLKIRWVLFFKYLLILVLLQIYFSRHISRETWSKKLKIPA